MSKLSRRAYADMYGPTKGDRVRLADTELFLEVEQDYCRYGEEVKFGGGKVIRDGMGQSQALAADCVDLVITNALILDYWGIVKADIGIKDGRIQAIGKAGNPDVQDGVNIVVGPATEVVAGEGKLVTAGGVDLRDVDFKGFESKKYPGLFFAGEVLNVDAITGGFNFQNAWTGAHLAAQKIAERLRD